MPALPWWLLAVFVLGINFAVWGAIGVIRLTETRTSGLSRLRTAKRLRPVRSRAGLPGRTEGGDGQPAGWKASLGVSDVAVLIPAHNEAEVIEASLDSITKMVPRQNVHVVSDGSTDDTPELARQAGVRVYETEHNVGKAGALRAALDHFRLIEAYPVVLLLDADTRIQPGYFAAALPLFDEPEVVAVAGCVRTARDRQLSVSGNVLVGHRQRIYAIGQRALKFGQTYLRVNATHIVPGFASMYRTEVLPLMDMNPPGLVIEDFNMTFEVYQKQLGKVAFTLSAVAVTQDPDNLRDYVRQTRRWAVGLWQTVRRHPPKANLFTAMLALLLFELITSSVIFLILPLIVAVLAIPDVDAGTLTWPGFAELHAAVAAHMTLSAVLFGVALPDYAMTCLVAALERRPRLLLVGVFFPLMRVIDAAIALSAVPAGWLVRSDGTWRSPSRRSVQAPQDRPAITGGQAGADGLAGVGGQAGLGATTGLVRATGAGLQRLESSNSSGFAPERGHASG